VNIERQESELNLTPERLQPLSIIFWYTYATHPEESSSPIPGGERYKYLAGQPWSMQARKMMACIVLSSFTQWRAVSTSARAATMRQTQWFDLIHSFLDGNKVLFKGHESLLSRDGLFESVHNPSAMVWLESWSCHDTFEVS